MINNGHVESLFVSWWMSKLRLGLLVREKKQRDTNGGDREANALKGKSNLWQNIFNGFDKKKSFKKS